MKKRIIASLAIIAALGLAIATYAYTQNPASLAATESCCKGKDSCPMKSKGHEGSGDHASMSCCKKHDGEHAKTDGQACCDCCGDSCPMKKGEGAATEGKSCCDNCDCCKGKSDTSA